MRSFGRFCFRALVLGINASVFFEIVPMAWAADGAGYVDFKAYYACMDRETAAGVKRSVEKGTKFYDVNTKQIGDQTFTLCTSRYSNGVAVQERDRENAEWRAKDALNVLMRADFEKRQAELREKAAAQAARDAPRLKEEGDAAARMYRECLFNSAKTIAVVSTEPAEIIREAVFAACRAERTAILEVHRRYRDEWFSEDALDVADKLLAGKVLLEIIKARAVPPSPNRPSEAPRRDPI